MMGLNRSLSFSQNVTNNRMVTSSRLIFAISTHFQVKKRIKQRTQRCHFASNTYVLYLFFNLESGCMYRTRVKNGDFSALRNGKEASTNHLPLTPGLVLSTREPITGCLPCCISTCAKANPSHGKVTPMRWVDIITFTGNSCVGSNIAQRCKSLHALAAQPCRPADSTDPPYGIRTRIAIRSTVGCIHYKNQTIYI